MSANAQNPQQHAIAELTRQLNALSKRQQELTQQLQTAQTELAGLGFMQLGRKMKLRGEVESLNGKLATNSQLQENLRARIAAAQAQPEPAADAEPAPAQEPEAPVIAEPAPVQEPEVPAVAEPEPVQEPEAPVVAESEPEPVLKPAVRKPRVDKPRKARPRAERPVVDEALPLQEQADRLMAHLERYYPEHQLFAAEVLTANARAMLNGLAQRSGLSVADFLAAQGWQLITPAQGRALRQESLPVPGSEPAVIQPKLQSVLARLTRHYPEKVISRSIQHAHKSLAQDVSALSAWLGYPSAGAMLSAYGFVYSVPASGRPSLDVDSVVEGIRAAYAGQPRPRTIAQIAADHPEYTAALKTLQNQAPRHFGMSLRQYFIQQGLL